MNKGLVLFGLVLLGLFLMNYQFQLPSGLFAVYKEISCSTSVEQAKLERKVPSSYDCSLNPIPTREQDCDIICRAGSIQQGNTCQYTIDCGYGQLCQSKKCVLDVCESGECLAANGCVSCSPTQKMRTAINTNIAPSQPTAEVNLGALQFPSIDYKKIGYGAILLLIIWVIYKL